MYELQVDGMTCGGCAAGVTRAVQAADSYARVEIDLRSKTVRVESGLALNEVVDAITKAGYPARTDAAA